MKKEEIVAQALVSWIADRLKPDDDIARELLPDMDVEYFFMSLSKVDGFVPDQYSIALAGFGHDSTSLAVIANKCGLGGMANIAADFNAAAAWRNSHRQNPRIIALAKGRQPGVHTLRHFASPTSRELSTAVLEWASRNDEYVKTPIQRELLELLAKDNDLEPLRSLDLVSGYLSRWSEEILVNCNDAPRVSLPELGLFVDSGLFNEPDGIVQRLVKNLQLKNDLINMFPTALRKRRSEIEKYKDPVRSRLLDIMVRIQQFKERPITTNLEVLYMQEVLDLFQPPKSSEQSDPPGKEEEYVDDAETEETETEGRKTEELGIGGLCTSSAKALLFNNEDELRRAADILERSWEEENRNDDDQVQGEVQFGGEEKTFAFSVDTAFLDWLHTFCNSQTWGGLIESKEPSLELSLKHHGNSMISPIKISPDSLVVDDGRYVSMSEMFNAFDAELTNSHGVDLGLAPLWRFFCDLRNQLIPSLKYLVYFPLLYLGGRPELGEIINKYLDISSEIYSIVQKNYRLMSDVSEGYARSVLEGLLTLDVFQVRIHLESNRCLHKAVLLPTHPLHVWRYTRLTSLLRGLGSQIGEADRDAIIKNASRPEQFLSVLWLGSLPEGRGAVQILPIANEIHGLAVFENLNNAVSSTDGVNELLRAIEYYVTLGRHHVRPLRVTIVNCPESWRVLSKLVTVLNKRRKSTLPCMRVEFVFTPDHLQRLRMAQRLSTEREIIEDKIASGRLELKICENVSDLRDIIISLSKNPCHILAIYDEASVRIRRRSIGKLLPMSPFCVRRQIRTDKLRNSIELEPTSDEPPFSEYIQLINEAERGQRDSSPHAWADAEALRRSIDEILLG
ncbi:MAG: hypothetical protein M1368_08970, partial [Thaumarchaeota archaeon]|nr:hypothetical protein [Nitrososphaerota archaeon]